MKRRSFFTIIAAALTATAHAATTKASKPAAAQAPTFEPSPPLPDFNDPATRNAIIDQSNRTRGCIVRTYNPLTNEWQSQFIHNYNPDYLDIPHTISNPQKFDTPHTHNKKP